MGLCMGERRPGVVRNHGMRYGRVVMVAGLLACAGFCADFGAEALGQGPPGMSPGMPTNTPPPRARALYQSGFDLFKRGDYETAANYYAEALKGQDQLSAREQNDLKIAIERNDVALGARREGAARVRMAEAALNQGKPYEAMNLLKLADTQYLAPADRQYMVRLQEKMRTTPANQGPNLPPVNVA